SGRSAATRKGRRTHLYRIHHRLLLARATSHRGAHAGRRPARRRRIRRRRARRHETGWQLKNGRGGKVLRAPEDDAVGHSDSTHPAYRFLTESYHAKENRQGISDQESLLAIAADHWLVPVDRVLLHYWRSQ